MTNQPRPSFKSPRFAQPATFMRLPYVDDPRGLDVAIVGVPYDGGTSYRPGARFGPREIRNQSSLIRSYSYFQKVAPFDTLNVADVGDIDAPPVSIEKAYEAIEAGVIDGTRFVQVGIRGPMYGEDDFDFHREHGITMIDIEQVKDRGTAWTIEEIRRIVTGPAYMTFDIDGVDPAFAPGTGTPEVGGLTSHEAQRLVRGLAGLKLVGGDVVEVAPLYDGPGQITAVLASNLMFEFLCALAK